jgi:hypothetical protein
MTARFQKLKDKLKTLEQDDMLSGPVVKKGKSAGLFQAGLSSPKWLKRLLFAGFVGSFILYAGITYTDSSSTIENPFTVVQNWANQPNEELLEGMGTWMEEMGYTDLSREDLIELREQGVTATFTSRMRDLGYTDLPLDQIVRLRQNDVSSTFAAMMKELGYDLSVNDLVELRQHDVTAYYTSNLHDLGYTNVTKEELIRLKDTGVQTSEIQELIKLNDERPTVEEVIRYHISNQ